MTREPDRTGATRGHLDTRTLLDYLDGHLEAAARRAAEDHLAGSCGDCRETLRALGAVRTVMRADRTPPVPDGLRARALEVFGTPAAFVPAPSPGRRLARMIFDSLAAPAPAAARRAVGDARRVHFTFGELALEVEFEPQEAGVLAARGRLTAPEPALHSVVFRIHGEALEAWPDAAGGFSIPRLPPGRLVIQVSGPAAAFETPPVDLGP